MHDEHTICSLEAEQLDVELINQADYLNVTNQRLVQIQQHTDKDQQLLAVSSVTPHGWLEHRDKTPLAAREHRAFKEELSVQSGALFKGEKVIIPRSLCHAMLP